MMGMYDFCSVRMLKLTKKDAASLALDEVCHFSEHHSSTVCKCDNPEHPSNPLTYCRVNGGGGQELPECLKELAGKDFVFKIHVTPYNFTPITTPFPFLQSSCGIILYMLKTFSSN